VKISLNWLRDYVALDAPVEEITRAITFLGFEVEHVVDLGRPARERRRRRGPLARQAPQRRQALRVHGRRRAGRRREDDRLRGENYKVGDRVPVALPGAVLPGDFRIRQSKIRGSSPTACSARRASSGWGTTRPGS
jgi:phenylalanyl-tRNA synthetase beta chain